MSFGLKPSARVVLNSAFLHELREAGLTERDRARVEDSAEESNPR